MAWVFGDKKQKVNFNDAFNSVFPSAFDTRYLSKRVLLWTNPNTSATIESGNYDWDIASEVDFSEYDEFQIEYAVGTSESTATSWGAYHHIHSSTGNPAGGALLCSGVESTDMGVLFNRVVRLRSNRINISLGIVIPLTGSEVSNSNNIAVPYKIYGIKWS